MSDIWTAMQHTQQVIIDCMPDVYPYIGWSDLHLKNAGPDVQAAFAGTAVMMATIRPAETFNLIDNSFGSYNDRHLVSILLAHPVERIADVETSIERTTKFADRLRGFIYKYADDKKLEGFHQVRLHSVLYPTREAGDNNALVDVNFHFITRGAIHGS